MRLEILLLQTGFNKPITQVTTAENDEIASAMIDFHPMAKVKCIMDQFMEGLKVFGLLDKIKQQPSVWEPLFVHSSALRLTEDGLKILFNVLFAEKGSNLRREQEQAYVHFVDFLDECSDGNCECSLEDILVFSEAAHIPPLGFEKRPTLSFNHGGRLATASTCDLQLHLPTVHGSNYPSFQEALILSIKGNDGCGGV